MAGKCAEKAEHFKQKKKIHKISFRCNLALGAKLPVHVLTHGASTSRCPSAARH
jgi:hypothetical protein